MITDRIKTKLSTWKGTSLSIMGRVQLVKSIIHGMLVYSFHVYLCQGGCSVLWTLGLKILFGAVMFLLERYARSLGKLFVVRGRKVVSI